MRFGSSRMAPFGQTSRHPPHEWQSSGKKRTRSCSTVIAPNWQNSPHRPQWSQTVSSTTGTGTVTSVVVAVAGKKRWRLGSSTSQSTSATRPTLESVYARLEATMLLPVPPFPLATASLTPRPPGRRSAGACARRYCRASPYSERTRVLAVNLSNASFTVPPSRYVYIAIPAAASASRAFPPTIPLISAFTS